MSSLPEKPPRSRARRRKLAFRLLAVLIGLSPFLITEGLCRIFDWGRPELQDDPFVGFSGVRPLFVPNSAGDRFEIAPARRRFFCPDSFSAKKPPGEFRIFCLGGSTVQGRPYAKETSFTTFLQLALQAADASRKWRVVNCGGVSYASYRLVPILQEVLRHDADLVIVCTGHNEFLEDRSYAHLKNPGVVARAGQVASHLRTYNLLRSGYLRLRGDSAEGTSADRPSPDRPVLPEEVEALLDYRGGLENYVRDDAWRQGVVEHYRYNLNRMVEICRQAKVPLLLACPVSNLRDCPPFKSEHRAGLTAAQLQQWQTHWDAARRLYQTNLPEALRSCGWPRRSTIAMRRCGISWDSVATRSGKRRTPGARIGERSMKTSVRCG